MSVSLSQKKADFLKKTSFTSLFHCALSPKHESILPFLSSSSPLILSIYSHKIVIKREVLFHMGVHISYTYMLQPEKKKKRDTHIQRPARVGYRWYNLSEEEICTMGLMDFWTAFFRRRNWIPISGYSALSKKTWRSCDLTTLQMVWMISFQKRILLNPLTTCFSSTGALILLYKYIQYTHVCSCLWMDLDVPNSTVCANVRVYKFPEHLSRPPKKLLILKRENCNQPKSDQIRYEIQEQTFPFMTAVPNSWFIDVIYFTQDAVMHKVQLFWKMQTTKKYLAAFRQWIQQIDIVVMKIKGFQV